MVKSNPSCSEEGRSLRAVADLRKVNKVADSYAMPDTQELLDQLAEAEWFTSIDLSSAFWQLPLAEESRDCTAFMTKTHGLLRWKALPMGFKNSSAYFQRAIEAALGGLRFTCCVVYIDDVVVHSKGSFEDHVAKVQAALRALRVVGLSGNPAKCKFAQREVFFLGHRVAEGKVYALGDKVKVMLDYKAPTSLPNCGAALVCSLATEGSLETLLRLHALTKQERSGQSQRTLKKEAKTTWSEAVWTEETSVQTCVSVASQRQTLASFATDAFIVAMGAVLSQYDDDNIEHPIGYYSSKLIDTETRWSISELELGAVVWASTLCRPYLRGVHFELVTDSKVVAALLTKDTRSLRG